MATKTTAHQLSDWLAEREAQPFDWTANNCCHFAAAWVAHATGRNPMAGLPTTPNARAALRLVRELGGSVASAWSLRLGRPPIAPGLAQVGDVVLVPSTAITATAADMPQADGTGSVVGICAGRTVILMDQHGAVHHLPLWEAEWAWRLHGDPVPADRAHEVGT